MVRTVAQGRDAVDLALINLCRPGDLVITQDYGVAAMALGRRCRAIHPSGMRYTQDNIDSLLMSRHLAARARRHGQHLKGSARRTPEDDRRFAGAFEQMLLEALAEA